MRAPCAGGDYVYFNISQAMLNRAIRSRLTLD